MKFFAATVALLAASASAFSTFGAPKTAKVALPTFSIESIPGALEPMGTWDPAGFAAKADGATLKRYREAEITHGRVAMLAVLGFLAGEAVAGTSFLWDASITGPAIDQFFQVPSEFWFALTCVIAKLEVERAKIGWVSPEDVPVGKAGLLRDEYVPGDLGFDPLGLKPSDTAAFLEMQTKELQNGRLAMIAAAGFLAQEAVNHVGILANLN